MVPVAVLDQKIEHGSVHQVQQPVRFQQGADVSAEMGVLLPPKPGKKDNVGLIKTGLNIYMHEKSTNCSQIQRVDKKDESGKS